MIHQGSAPISDFASYRFRLVSFCTDVLLFRQELQAQIELRRREVERISRQVRDDVSDDVVVTSRRCLVERFEGVSCGAAAWQARLQTALVQCRDFHRTIEHLHDWLGGIDLQLRAVEPIDLTASQPELARKLSHLQVSVNQSPLFV